MVVAYFEKNGKLKTDKFTLKKEVFGVEVNRLLISMAVDSYLANQRQSNANVKTRAEVSGGGKKPWKQKGTGRARVGSSRSPIWRGGGVSFGPKSTDNYSKSLSKKMAQNAIRSAFSLKAQEESIVVYEDIDLGKEVKTKKILKILNDFAKEKVLVILPEGKSDIFLAARNIKNVIIKGVNEINTFTILNAKKVIILEKSLEKIYEYWLTEKETEKEEKKIAKEVKEVKAEKVEKVVKEVKKIKKPVAKLKKKVTK